VAALVGWFHTDTAVRAGETGAALRLATRAVELGERIASSIYRVYGSRASPRHSSRPTSGTRRSP
jgi:hypothetical protein